MKKLHPGYLLYITGYIFILMISACSSQTTNVDVEDLNIGNCNCIYNKQNDPDTGTNESTDLPFSGGNARDLFNYPHVPLFDIYLPQEAWENLKINAVKEEYAEAKACFEGGNIGRVGIRFKGSYGSLYNCFDRNGKNICRKLGIKIKFNEYDRNNRFFGLKRLNFHGNRYDNTYIRERLAYDLYREMGIIAPRAAWAMLRVNNEFLGLFGMVEEVDGCFAADRWPENPDGNLYKEAWPVSTDRDWVVSRLETNSKEPNVDAFIAFSMAINSAAEDELKKVLGRFMDFDYMARYMAVDDAIANYDGITAYYATEDASMAGNHNYYLYEESNNRFTIIPWDMESTFMVNSGFGNVPRWTHVPGDCSKTYGVWRGENHVIAPGCDRIFRAMVKDFGRYQETCRVLLDGPFMEEAMQSAIDRHAAFIRTAAKADPNGPGLIAFEKGINSLKKEIPRLRSRLERLIARETWKPIEIDLNTCMDFEKQDNVGLYMGTDLHSNPNTNVSVEFNTRNPIAGNQDLVMSFEFVNEKDSFGQWASYCIPLVSGPKDLTAYTGLRMKMRADNKRTLRFDIDSPHCSAADQGICFGWDIHLTRETAATEVRFADASIVSWAVNQGKDPGDKLKDVLAVVNGITFYPQCNGRKSNGQLPEGSTDKGFIQIDNIEFF